jgi:tetratricopeptide (TPR) repeat protein
MVRSLAVVVTLASMSTWACVNGTFELSPPGDGAASLVAARKALAEGRYEAALQLAQRALEEGVQKAQKKWAHRVSGEAQLKLGRPEDAIRQFNATGSEFADDAVFTSLLAQAELRAGQASGGERLEALARNEMMPDAAAWYWLARARQSKGELETALVAAKEAVKLNPKDAEAQKLVKELSKPKRS